MGEKLVALFGRRIKTDGIVNLIVGRVRYFFIRAVNRRRRSVNKMLNGMIAAGFKYIIEADNIALYVNVGIGYRITHTRLSGKIDNNVKAVFREKLFNKFLIGNITLYKRPVPAECGNFLKAVLFYGNVVIVVHIVNADYPDTVEGIEKLPYKIGAYKTRRARNKHGFAVKNYILF